MAQNNLLENFLRHTPLALGIIRANECAALRRLPIESPVLDIGCGDGTFGAVCFEKNKIEVGLDLDPREIRLAKEKGVYSKLIVASASQIPFPDNYFKTVIANSVFEHILDLQPVLREIWRVLAKDGRLICTVPTELVSRYLFFPGIFKKIGLPKLAQVYIQKRHQIWRHSHLGNQETWTKSFLKASFEVKRVFGLNSPSIISICDILYPLSFPSYLIKKLLGKTIILRPRFISKLLADIFERYCQDLPDCKGATLCFLLVKGKND